MTEQVVINRQDPEIEAYRLGLLGDVQGFVRNQIFGQQVQNLRGQGLTDAAIAERLSTEAAPVTEEQIRGISADAQFAPPDYQVAQLSDAERRAAGLAESGVGAFQQYLTQGAGTLGQGVGAISDFGLPGLQEAMAVSRGAAPILQQAQALADQTRNLPYEYQQRAAQGLQQATQLGTGIGTQAVGQLGQATQLGTGIGVGGIGSLMAAERAIDPQVLGAQLGLYGQTGEYNPYSAFAFMNPYEQAVIDSTLRDIARQGDIAQQNIAAQAVGAGAFGGSRQAVAEQELGRNVLEQQARTAAQLRSQGFTQAAAAAQQAFEQARARGLTAAQAAGQLGLQGVQQRAGIGQATGQLGTQLGQLGQQGAQAAGQLGVQLGQLGQAGATAEGNLGLQFGQLAQRDVELLGNLAQQRSALGQGLGSLAAQYGTMGTQLGALGQQQANLGQLQSQLQAQDIQNLMTTGGAQRAVEQASLEAERMSNLQRYSQPYQQYGFLSDIYAGVPTSQASMTATSAPQVSPFQTAVGLGIQGLSAAAGAQRAGII